MPISDQQLHHAAKYITDRCKFREASFGSDKLSKTDQECLHAFLIRLFHLHNRERVIAIGLHTKPMKPLRQYLGKNKILFPEKTQIVIHSNGITTCNNETIFEYNDVKNKAMQKARRLTSEAVLPIRRNSSSEFSDADSSIGRQSSTDVTRSIKRTTSDSSLSIQRASNSFEVNSLTFQFSALSAAQSSTTTDIPDDQEVKDPQKPTKTFLRMSNN